VDNKSTQFNPVNTAERIDILDALRGFAIFGIFMINVRVFSGYSYISDELKNKLLLSAWDPFFDSIHIVFFSGKFYTLFSLLFGIGFAIQIVRASNANRPFIRHFSRRLFLLLLIGLVHLWVLWFSDILVFYAMCGFLLLFFRKLSNNGLLWLMFFLLLLPGLHSWYIYTTNGGYTTFLYEWLSKRWMAADLPQASAEYHTFHMADISRVIRDGSWNSIVKFNAIGPILRLYIIAYDLRIIKILAMFILGFWIGRNIINNKIHTNRPFLIKTAVTGFLIGLPLNIFFVLSKNPGISDSYDVLIKNTLDTFGYISLASAYAAIFALLYRTGVRKFMSNSFNSVGKTALSNYILQSILGILLFYSVGLGLGEYFGSTLLTLSVVLIFGFQILISNIWLKYFRFGPVEWVWRVLTYGSYLENRIKIPSDRTHDKLEAGRHSLHSHPLDETAG
jgi:uncharacterized protein